VVLDSTTLTDQETDMRLGPRTWTAALAATAIVGTGIGVAAASGPATDDTPVRPASSTSAPGVADDDGTLDQGRGDRPAIPLPTGSASATGGRHTGDDGDDRSGRRDGDDDGGDRSGPGDGDDDWDDD
jgi:hypothetical protein